MPPKKQTRSSRGRRTVPRQRPATPSAPATTAADASDLTEQPASHTTARVAATRSRSSRAPAQIVIGDYSYLRYDLRLLGILAPSMIIIMVVLSFVLH
jgi:hypothetical protein